MPFKISWILLHLNSHSNYRCLSASTERHHLPFRKLDERANLREFGTVNYFSDLTLRYIHSFHLTLL